MKIDRSIFMTELARNCMTLKDLSVKSGVNTVTLARIKNGSQEPQPATIGKIAKALNITVEALIEG